MDVDFSINEIAGNGIAGADCVLYFRGGQEAQDEYLQKLRNGDRENEGGKSEWAEKIELVDGKKDDEEVISSTKVREAAKARDETGLRKLVTDRVAQWILDEKLYTDQS